MSRREGRESDSRRHRSRFDREPSPKRYRKDGKPEAERVSTNTDPGERDGKHSRQLLGISSLEAPSRFDSKAGSAAEGKDSEKKAFGTNSDGRKHPSNPTEVPRSRSYFQHDERGSAGQGGRSSGQRARTERGWWKDSKGQGTERATKTATVDVKQREDNPRKGDDSSTWRHDGFFEMEANQALPAARKRPAFREHKFPVDIDADKVTDEAVKPSHAALDGERNEERRRYPHNSERSGNTYFRDRARPYKREDQRSGGFISRERYGGGGSRYNRGRESFNGRQTFRPGGARI
ncbi:Btz domain-containing protein, partial [Psidium guajava]